MIEINGIALDFDILDADNAGIFEEEQAKIADIKKILNTNVSLKTKIMRACKIVHGAIDRMYGEGTAEKLFEDKNNLRETARVWKLITQDISDDAENTIKEALTDEPTDQ